MGAMTRLRGARIQGRVRIYFVLNQYFKLCKVTQHIDKEIHSHTVENEKMQSKTTQ